MYPLSLFIFFVCLDILIIFMVLRTMKNIDAIPTNLFGSLFTIVMSYIISQQTINGTITALKYGDSADLMITETVSSLPLHYIFLGCSVLMTVIFFIIVIGYIKYMIEKMLD